MKPTLLRRALTSATLVLAALTAALPPGAVADTPALCGLTTLQGTLVADPAAPGTLKCGPGQPIVVREELARANPGRADVRDALASFVAFADFQVVDEESPLRGEFLDKCTTHPAEAAFRWHETMIPHLVDAHVRAANAIARGPVTGRSFDFAVQLGDAVDNRQWNEVRWFMTLLDGSAAPDRSVSLVNPDSGADGYEGVQGRDPATGTPALRSPVDGVSLRDVANEPFFATGLRRPDGSRLPWYSVAGNHDDKVQGTVPNNEAWIAFAHAWVAGDLKVTDLAPDQQQRVCADPALLADPGFWMEVAGNPAAATTRRVTSDAHRRLVDRTQWIAEHLPPAAARALDPGATGSHGLPAGHGFLTPDGKDNRCRDGGGNLVGRSCYAFTMAGDPGLPTPVPIRFIALDTGADEGFDEGNISPGQWDWLKRELVAHSTSYYDEAGNPQTNPAAENSLVVVFSHHPLADMTNTATTEKRYTGADLGALLLQFPNVILHANGHAHAERVIPHARTGAGGKPVSGYWEVGTSAVADWPHLSRTIEIADNHDGTLSIAGVGFDGLAPPNPRKARWNADITPETAFKNCGECSSVKRNVNESWLASAAREVGYNDPQQGAAAAGAVSAEDRNVELLVAHPFGTTRVRGIRRTAPPPQPPVFPGFFPPPQFPPFPFPTPPAPNLPRVIPPTTDYRTTGPGIGVPSPFSGPDVPLRGTLAMAGAAALAAWLFRARVRGWMLGR